jgi:hypothetical protein
MNPFLTQLIRAFRRPLIRLLAGAATLAAASGQPLLHSWEGINVHDNLSGGTLNIHGAPGPVGVLATVETRIQYFTKSGATVWGPLSLRTFWSHVGPSFLKQPKVVFDHDSRRFFVICGDTANSRSWLNVAVTGIGG